MACNQLLEDAMLEELTIEANEESFVIVLQHGGNDVTWKQSTVIAGKDPNNNNNNNNKTDAQLLWFMWCHLWMGPKKLQNNVEQKQSRIHNF